MPLSGLRILIVEDEYLIALDAEHVLLEAGAARVTICTRAQFAETLAADRYDALLVDTGPDRTLIDADVALARAAGARIAFTTSDTELVAGISGHDGVQFIAKPYHERQLNALVEVLRGRVAENQTRPSETP